MTSGIQSFQNVHVERIEIMLVVCGGRSVVPGICFSSFSWTIVLCAVPSRHTVESREVGSWERCTVPYLPVLCTVKCVGPGFGGNGISSNGCGSRVERW